MADSEERALRAVALRNAEAILRARQEAEAELVATKEALERKSEELSRSIAALQESEQRFRAAFAQAAVGIAITDLDGRFEEVNRRFAEIVGYQPDELIGKTILEVMHPDDLEVTTARVQGLGAGERDEAKYETRYQRKDGAPIWTATSLTLIRGQDGQPQRLIGVIADISDRRQADALRARLAAVVESSDDAIISKTLDGVIVTWNAAAERIFGYAADEAIGRPITILFPEERLGEEPTILGRLRRGERVEHYETVRRRRDGTLIDVALTASPVRDSTGTIIGASKIARDITERRRIEAALREESRILELLNETGLAIGTELGLAAIVQAVTDKATQLSGARFGAFFYNTEDERGESFDLFALSGAPRAAFDQFGLPRNTEVFGPTFRGEAVVRLDDVTQDPRYGRNAPHAGMPKGHLPVRSYLAAPVVSRSGGVIGGLFFGHPEPGVFTERSERLVAGVAAQASVAIDNARLYEDVKRAAEERASLLEAERAARTELERSSQSKDEFLATLSHELRTPLTAILGWTQLLRGNQLGDADRAEGIDVIERNARSLSQLIGDLLDMSRIMSGKIRLDLQRVELQEVIAASVASMRPAAESKGIRLQVLLEPQAGPIRGDPDRLHQCVWNLLSNAVKFTPKGGRIQVGLQRVNSHVEITVTDNGVGIDPEFLPQLFQRFRQSDASTTRRHGGLGLGLSIVKNLVELHGGTIRASSAGLGQGATFCIELPLFAVDLSPGAVAGRTHPRAIAFEPAGFDRPALHGVRVLVVDDDADAREMLRRVLADCGAQVFVAPSAAGGMEVVRSEELDMIVSDIGMPEQDGYEFIRQVRRHERGTGLRTPAAALTAFARAEDRMRALRAGYQIHVAKPVDLGELTAVVASLAIRR